MRTELIEAGAKGIFYSGERTKGLVWDSINDDQRRFYRQMAIDAFDAFLDTLEDSADDVSDMMAKGVGDYWTHQTRRALASLIAALRSSGGSVTASNQETR